MGQDFPGSGGSGETTRGLMRLIDEVGLGQIVLGTDYPFDKGHYDPGEFFRGLDESSQRLISGETAGKLLGVD